MNFLAHAYLSGDSEDLLIGNFIADAVKGKEILKFSEGIQKGIELHRKIDHFTDAHPEVLKSIQFLKQHFRRYSPVVIDIYLDHFLATSWSNHHHLPLDQYVQNVYSIIKTNLNHLPVEVNEFFPYMERQNWLYNYSNLNGIHNVFQGMSRRANFSSNMENGVQVLEENYTYFNDVFSNFFPDIKQFVGEQIS